MRITENLQQNFPFISVVNHVSQEYVGVVINQDAQVTSMYDYSLIKTDEEKARFIELGEVWWWESNRTIPISIFLKSEMEAFRYSIMTMNTKDVTVVFGPTINLHNMSIKRVKRKMIQLVRPKR